MFLCGGTKKQDKGRGTISAFGCRKEHGSLLQGQDQLLNLGNNLLTHLDVRGAEPPGRVRLIPADYSC